MVATLSKLIDLMRHNGTQRIYAKKLAPNDNSKNQVYLGGGFGALNIIPHGEIITDDRPLAGAKRERPKAKVDFWWIDDGGMYNAPDAQLILYPDYPEVRMSGFLKGCRAAPSQIMTVRAGISSIARSYQRRSSRPRFPKSGSARTGACIQVVSR